MTAAQQEQLLAELREEVEPEPDFEVLALCERIRRCGTLDTDEIWVASSGDSYRQFQARHGTYEWGENWHQLQAKDKARAARAAERDAEQRRQWREALDRRRTELLREAQHQAELRAAEQQQALIDEPTSPQAVMVSAPWVQTRLRPGQTNVEPWFDRTKAPTYSGMLAIGRYILGIFPAMRGGHVGYPLEDGLDRTGDVIRRIECHRTADDVSAALTQLSHSMPRLAQLSAKVERSLKGFSASVGNRYLAVRVTSTCDERVAIDLSWDEA